MSEILEGGQDLSGASKQGPEQDPQQDATAEDAQDTQQRVRRGRRRRHARREGSAGMSDAASSLPDELLLQVFRHLNNRQLVRARRVCRRWRDVAMTNDVWRYRELRLTYNMGFGPFAVPDSKADSDNENDVEATPGSSRKVTPPDQLQRGDDDGTQESALCVGKLVIDGPVQFIGPLVRFGAKSLHLRRVRVGLEGMTIVATHLLERLAPYGPLKELACDLLDVYSGGLGPFFAALNACRPQILDVCFFDVPEFEPAGLRAPPEPYVRELTFVVHRMQGPHGPGHMDLLRYLLDAHANTLEAFQFSRRSYGPYFQPPPLSATLLSGCVRLERLSCSILEDMESLLELPRLASIDFTVRSKCSRPVVAFFRRATQLRHLTISRDNPEDGDAVSNPPVNPCEYESLFYGTVKDMLEALASSRKSKLECLQLFIAVPTGSPSHWSDIADILARGFPSLQEIRVDATRFRFVAKRLGGAVFSGDVDDGVLIFLRCMEAVFPLRELHLLRWTTKYSGTSSDNVNLAEFVHLKRLVGPVCEFLDEVMAGLLHSVEVLKLTVQSDDWERTVPLLRKSSSRLRRLRITWTGPFRGIRLTETATLQMLEALTSSGATSSLEFLHIRTPYPSAQFPLERYWELLAAVITRLVGLEQLAFVRGLKEFSIL